MAQVPPRREDIINDGQASLRFIQFLEGQFKDSTGLQTDVDNNTNSITSNALNIAINTAAIGSLIVVTSNYSQVLNQRILCNAPVTVTLNVAPANDEKVYIKRLSGAVTINGNGKTIDGSATLVLNVAFSSVYLVYSSLLGAWFII